jgi:hypothetical protein
MQVQGNNHVYRSTWQVMGPRFGDQIRCMAAMPLCCLAKLHSVWYKINVMGFCSSCTVDSLRDFSQLRPKLITSHSVWVHNNLDYVVGLATHGENGGYPRDVQRERGKLCTHRAKLCGEGGFLDGVGRTVCLGRAQLWSSVGHHSASFASSLPLLTRSFSAMNTSAGKAWDWDWDEVASIFCE